MGEVEVIDVDKFETICCLPINTVIGRVFEYLSEKTEVQNDYLILYTTDGFVLNRFQTFSQQLKNSLKLFLFRKNTINLEYWINEVEWENFSTYPVKIIYNNKINFKDYEALSPPFEKIAYIEERLFNNSIEAKRLYALYMIKEQGFEKLKKLATARLEASSVLLNNLKLYYKSIKANWKELFRKGCELQREVNEAHSSFDANYEKIKNKSFGVNVDEIIRHGRFRGFSYDIYTKVNNFCNKINNLKSKTLGKITEERKKSLESLVQVQNTNFNFIENAKKRNLFDREYKFKEGLEAVTVYNQFRATFQIAEEHQNTPERNLYGERMLRMDEEINKYSDILKELGKSLREDFQLYDKEYKQHLERIGKLQWNQPV